MYGPLFSVLIRVKTSMDGLRKLLAWISFLPPSLSLIHLASMYLLLTSEIGKKYIQLYYLATIEQDLMFIIHSFQEPYDIVTYMYQGSTFTVVQLPGASEMRLRASENGTQLVRSGKWKWFCDMFNSWRAKLLMIQWRILPKHRVVCIVYLTLFPFLK